MSGYKLIALDMDGTLLDSGKCISPSTLQAIERAVDTGKHVAISTGRCLAEMKPYIKQLKCVRYFVLSSGAIVYDMKRQTRLYENLMPADVAAKVMQLALPERPMVHILTDDSIVQRSQEQAMGKWGMGVYKPLYDLVATLVDDIYAYFAASPFPVAKLNLYHLTEESRLRSRARLAPLSIEVANAEKTSLECSAYGVSKALGVRSLCDAIGITMDQVIAVGDADNDLALLKAVGFSVAMGNANDVVKAACCATVSDNDTGGCCEAIERFLL